MSKLDKARPRLLKWCRGLGVDLGCAKNKISENAIGIDRPFDVFAPLPFKDNIFDFVFSSHCLEDAESDKAPKILEEWLRILKPRGFLILYMPDKGFYYNVGHPRANRDHKADYYWQDIMHMLGKRVTLIHSKRYGRWKNNSEELNRVDYNGKEPYGEHCFELVMRKKRSE